MTKKDLRKNEDPPVVYFDSYCEMLKFVSVIPQAAANVAYFDPAVQKWTMVDNAG